MHEVVDDLLKLLFGGESLPLFQHLIEDRGLTDAEFEKLRVLLDETENRKS